MKECMNEGMNEPRKGRKKENFDGLVVNSVNGGKEKKKKKEGRKEGRGRGKLMVAMAENGGDGGGGSGGSREGGRQGVTALHSSPPTCKQTLDPLGLQRSD